MAVLAGSADLIGWHYFQARTVVGWQYQIVPRQYPHLEVTVTGGYNKTFLIGETIHLEAEIQDPRDGVPADPETVEIVDFKCDDESVSLPEGAAFARIYGGRYRMLLDTTDLGRGKYTYRVRAHDGYGTAITEDSFLLEP